MTYWDPKKIKVSDLFKAWFYWGTAPDPPACKSGLSTSPEGQGKIPNAQFIYGLRHWWHRCRRHLEATNIALASWGLKEENKVDEDYWADIVDWMAFKLRRCWCFQSVWWLVGKLSCYGALGGVLGVGSIPGTLKQGEIRWGKKVWEPAVGQWVWHQQRKQQGQAAPQQGPHRQHNWQPTSPPPSYLTTLVSPVMSI